MEEIYNTNNSIYVCSQYYDKISEHLVIMNNWKNDPDLIKKFPSLSRDFNMFDSLVDLLMKGGL